MRTTIIGSYVGFPQFAESSSETLEVLSHHTRDVVTARCGCCWTGLHGRVGGGVSDGAVHLCPEHAIEEVEHYFGEDEVGPPRSPGGYRHLGWGTPAALSAEERATRMGSKG